MAHTEVGAVNSTLIFSKYISLTNSWWMALLFLTNYTPITAVKSYLQPWVLWPLSKPRKAGAARLDGAAAVDRRPGRTYLQLRQTEEQVKYSSGKKLRVMRLSEISPQKRLLKAWRGNRAGG